ncbi:hypothetical protein ACFFWD_07860 [Bradyrhizobium erythrophlei]|uniref:hypothetical protein n=1 Tax=Bradyrhizobium erythrophlei TaxID=1437360 RepID=UPI0035ECA283
MVLADGVLKLLKALATINNLETTRTILKLVEAARDGRPWRSREQKCYWSTVTTYPLASSEDINPNEQVALRSITPSAETSRSDPATPQCRKTPAIA